MLAQPGGLAGALVVQLLALVGSGLANVAALGGIAEHSNRAHTPSAEREHA